MILRLTLLVALLPACAPSQHDPQRYGSITVAFGPALDSAGPFRADQLDELVKELTALEALGPSFVVGSEGAADLVVRPFDSGPRCLRGSGRFTVGTRFVEIDPACAPGMTALRAAMGHEIGHALGMQHVCFGSEIADCSPVGRGVALMNPNLSYGDATDPNATVNDIATDVPTELDLAEFRRAHP
jgi:hypothetical protein